VIYGAGAVGGLLAHRLVLGGAEVSVIARGAHLDAIRDRGLTVMRRGERSTVRVEAAGSFLDLMPPDLVIVTVQSQHTEVAADQVRRSMLPSTWVLSLQNGVDNEEKLAQRIPKELIIGGSVVVSTEVVEPGVIVHRSGGRIKVGELVPGASARVQRIVEVLRTSGLHVDAVPNILAAKWAKLLWNAPFNALTALTRSTPGELLADPWTSKVVRGCMDEVVAVGAAKGITLGAEQIEPVLQTLADSDDRTSMLVAIEAGKSLEHEALNGYVVRQGEALGVPTPINRTLHALLQFADPAASVELGRSELLAGAEVRGDLPHSA